VHHGFNDNCVFKHQDGADQVIGTPFQRFECPQVSFVLESGVTRIKHVQQFCLSDVSLCHSQGSVMSVVKITGRLNLLLNMNKLYNPQA